jgi:hypothetical protein
VARVKRRRSREAHEHRTAKRPADTLCAGPARSVLRTGSYFEHPAGRMVILWVYADTVLFTYADDDGSQYPRRMDRDGFDTTYGRTR